MATEKNQTPKNAGTETKQDESLTDLQAVFDEANEKGYFGEVTDPTPNEEYTVAGQAAKAKGKSDGKR